MIKHKGKGFLILCLVILGLIVLLSFNPIYQYINKSSHPIKYQDLVEQYADEYSVDKFLLYAFIRTESGFNKDAESKVGARGLLQITEETFMWIKSKIARSEELVFDDMYEPEVSIRFGTYYIAQSLHRYHNDVSTAAAAYHSGWGTVDKLLNDEKYSSDGQVLNKFPYEQMNLYVYKINKNYKKYIDLYQKN